MKHLALLLLTLFLLCPRGAATAQTTERPNIIFILTDDQRWDALGHSDNEIIQTPHMDRLAGEGLYFDNAFVTTPICAASRASIFTGMYERSHGFTFCEHLYDHPYIPKSEGIRTRRWKYFRYIDHPETEELYDLEKDPQEIDNLADRPGHQDRLAGFRRRLEEGMAELEEDARYGQWESIFNGKDLTGWRPKFTGNELGVNYKNTFRVEDGKLVVSYDNYESFDDKFGHIFYKEKLSHYKLRLDYRFVGEQVPGAPDWAYKNSGIKFHSQPPEIIPKDQRLLVAVEAQLLGGNGVDERPTGNVCTAGTHIVMDGKLITQHCTNSSSETYHGDQWVTMEIEVRGNEKVIHRVNGEVVLEYEKPQLDESDPFSRQLLDQGVPRMLSEGYIALQAESHPVEFRNIELMRLRE